MRRPLDGDQLAMLTPRDAQPVTDLADRGVGLDRLDEGGNQIVPGPRSVVEAPKGCLPRRGFAPCPDAPEAIDLTALRLRVDSLDPRAGDGVVAETVHADHDPL